METSKRKKKPQLFEIEYGYTKHNVEYGYTKHYVIAYDVPHALTAIKRFSHKEDESLTVKKVTGRRGPYLTVAKECLPQGLIDKEVTT